MEIWSQAEQKFKGRRYYSVSLHTMSRWVCSRVLRITLIAPNKSTLTGKPDSEGETEIKSNCSLLKRYQGSLGEVLVWQLETTLELCGELQHHIQKSLTEHRCGCIIGCSAESDMDFLQNITKVVWGLTLTLKPYEGPNGFGYLCVYIV